MNPVRLRIKRDVLRIIFSSLHLTVRMQAGLSGSLDTDDKGCNCLYMKLCDLILLSMILQLE